MEFRQKVKEVLGYYVYALVDPNDNGNNLHVLTPSKEAV